MGGELNLGEAIIQRIQSFLTGKEAALTTVLSKSWHSAWLTRPKLDLDESDFPGYWNFYTDDEFMKFVRKIIKRYEESNLNIECFRLHMNREWYDYDGSKFASQLIVKALKMGATSLSLRTHNLKLVVPHEVFETENLAELCVKGYTIDLGMAQKVRCSRLESLSLSCVAIEPDIISNIISSCPLIKNLSFSYICLESVGSDLINLHQLRCLVLRSVEFDTLFFRDLSSKIPSLKELTLESGIDFLEGREEIWICSRSLERLNFAANCPRSRIKFDVPSIRKFTFKGPIIDSLSFKSTSAEWESHVSLPRCNLSTSWFHQLNGFLRELSRSRIHLSLQVDTNQNIDYEMEDIQCLHKPGVENLTMDMEGLRSFSLYALFDGLFRSCRPKFITQYLHPKFRSRWKTNNEFLCKTFVREMNVKSSSTPSNLMYDLHDIMEVNLQLFDEGTAVWKSLPLESLLDVTATPEKTRKIRFLLKWKP